MDHVVDTNVLLVASAAHPYSPFDDSHVPVERQKEVFEWLAAFRADEGRKLVLDDFFEIYDEYRNKLTDQDYGLQVVKEKLERCLRQVNLQRAPDGRPEVPKPFERFDPSDRKLLAAALTDPSTVSIVNATDSDWLDVEEELAGAGVTVVHILEEWLRATHAARK